MGLDDYCVREHCQQFIQAVYVVGRLKNPAPLRTPELQLLKKLLLPAVCRTKVRPVQKRLVCRDMTDRDEFFGQKCITMDRHALMRRTRAHRVNRIRSRGEPAKPPQRSFGLPHTWIDLFWRLASNGNGKHHLPNPGHPVFGVFR